MAQYDGRDDIACEKCGAIHEVSYKDWFEKDSYDIGCLVPDCGGTVIRGRGTREYLKARLKK